MGGNNMIGTTFIVVHLAKLDIIINKNITQTRPFIEIEI